MNDDRTTYCQFLPKISLDPTTGDLAVVWYDSRNDLGTGGPADTDGIRDDDAQFWRAFSTDGGASFGPYRGPASRGRRRRPGQVRPGRSLISRSSD